MSRRRSTVRLSVECWGGGKDVNSRKKDSGRISLHPQKKRNCRSEWFPLCHSALRGVSYCQASSLPGVYLLKSPHCLFLQPAISLPWVPAPHNFVQDPSWLPVFLKAPLHTAFKLQLLAPQSLFLLAFPSPQSWKKENRIDPAPLYVQDNLTGCWLAYKVAALLGQ